MDLIWKSMNSLGDSWKYTTDFQEFVVFSKFCFFFSQNFSSESSEKSEYDKLNVQSNDVGYINVFFLFQNVLS